MSIFVITHLFNDSLFLPLFVGFDTRDLSCGIIGIGHDFSVGISHGAHAVPTVVGGTIDIGTHIGCAHHHRANGLYNLALVAVVIDFATRSVFHEHQSSCTVVLFSRFAIGVGNAVEEVLGVEYLAQPFVVIGISHGASAEIVFLSSAVSLVRRLPAAS